MSQSVTMLCYLQVFDGLDYFCLDIMYNHCDDHSTECHQCSYEEDIRISEDLIRKYYDLSSIPGGDNNMTLQGEDGSEKDGMEITEGKLKSEKRAATAHTNLLWTNARVPYNFLSTIPTNLRHSIRDAMNHWEDRTCLRFTFLNSENDCMEYINNDTTCWSYIGRRGGKQEINMNRDHGCRFGTIVHEIRHAVGFWHEQSRPDHDSYVRINLNNIEQ